ncbi:Arrestin domain-containing protein 3 [Orchesella cincta]|uniref:Arrestin domain-containing protein 3 n=1 Tax=Orchesella cincta TaxID=48709 RepID=A0A1D2MKJ1_ORCCI|nr:Arrestin domain-containing protein 3 [Orchesella cincta]
MAEVEIVNKCGRHISNFLAAICQRLEYRSNGGVREKLNLFCEVSRGKGLDNGQSETWNVELVVPDLPPTKLGGTCSIIVVEYAVVVWSAPKTWSDSLINFCPIVIGSEGEAVPTIAKSLI